MNLERHLMLWITAGVGVGAGLVTIDVLTDGETVTGIELLADFFEKTLIVFGAGGVLLLFREGYLARHEKASLVTDLEVARKEGLDWRHRAQSHVAGLAAEIDGQFQRWGLTDAETEVGMLVLKGLSHKEIAAVRGTAEATVRQQARVVYQKSGLPGKTAFAAYFLEDLLPPAGLRRPIVAPGAGD